MMSLEYSVAIVCSPNYLGQVKTLVDSILKFNSVNQINVLLTENDVEYELCWPNVVFYCLRDIGLDKNNYFELNIFEFSCFLRPFFVEYILLTSKKSVLFCDSDLYFLKDPIVILNEMGGANLLLTKHFFEKSLPLRSYSDYLLNGFYNGGLVCYNFTSTTFEILRWLKNAFEYSCFNRKEYTNSPHLFVDQSWLMYLPMLFEGVTVSEHCGINAGHWTLMNHEIRYYQDEYYIDNVELVCFHFSGLKEDNKCVRLVYLNRNLNDIEEACCREYLYLEKANIDCSRLSTYELFSNGRLINDFHRKYYYLNRDKFKTFKNPRSRWLRIEAGAFIMRLKMKIKSLIV